jgi:hypothetical protein
VTAQLSVLLLVPINDRGQTSTPDNRPADWKQQMNGRDRLHYVRVAVINPHLHEAHQADEDSQGEEQCR